MTEQIWSDETGPIGTWPLADVIVLIHGSMDRSTGMGKVSRQLDGNHRVVRYDRRGYGRSCPHPGPFGIDEQVDDLMRVLGGRRAVVVGHSYGGNVALAAAQAHRDQIAGVALYETPLSWLPWWPKNTAGGQAIATSDDDREAAERFMRRLIGDDRWEALPERTRRTRRSEGAALVGELTDIGARAAWQPELIKVPVVVGIGSGGAGHHHRGMRHAAEVIEGAQLVELYGCHHDAPLRHPNLFVDKLVRPLLGE